MPDNKRYTTMDEYIAAFPEKTRAALEAVRQSIHKAVPEATETMSYGMPTFNLHGKHLVFFAGWKRHLSVHPLPAGDAAFQQAIAPYRRAKGTLRFPLDQPIPSELVEHLVTLLRLESPNTRGKGVSMKHVQSADGTAIAYDQLGNGPAVILVDGALGYRALGYMEPLATGLSPSFRVITYDRRGRGESTDTQPFALEREIEDIQALINEVGGEAYVYGISSGAALALEATLTLGKQVKKLALYEPPYNDEEAARLAFRNYQQQLADLLSEGRTGGALGLFMLLVGMPPDHLEGARQLPMWPRWEAVAHTLPYDAAALGEDGAVPIEKAARIQVPTLVMDGSASFPFMHTTAAALAKALPNGEHRTLPGQTHEVEAHVLAPVLVAFFTGNAVGIGEQDEPFLR
ncbi:MAG TPA: alpha/beta fold hydrolase [Ktedonobacterales bacterium]|nr:alpha/beta fold hydrolase [Ktedonobacterales bacterium]